MQKSMAGFLCRAAFAVPTASEAQRLHPVPVTPVFWFAWFTF
jgi:hypothetical protein